MRRNALVFVALTVAVLAMLASGKYLDKARKHGAVVLVDEAGQIGGKQMLELLRLVRENEGRVILSGDTHQHGAVEAPTHSGPSKNTPGWNMLN